MSGLMEPCVNMLNAIGGGIDGTILDRLALGPAEFSASMYGMTSTVHAVAVKPVAATVASIVFTLELARASARADGDRELGVRIIGTVLLKCALVLLFAQHAGLILQGIDGITSTIVKAMFGVLSNASGVESQLLGDQMRAAIEDAGVVGQAGLMVLVLIPFFVSQVAGVVLLAVVYMRFMQIYMLSCFASLPVVFMASDHTRSMGIGYLRRYGQASFQAITLTVGVVLYRAFIGEALTLDGYVEGSDLWQYVISNFGTLMLGAIMLGCLVMVSSATAKAVFGE
ncbi:hypothetical protein [Bifidobacterium miconisargentati]|uniref:hypothetical protein n=1 Tax=Bifidobacterium miconisargentati TaxID=2834437 RepID=UPI001BDC88D8|nr:hypothetical protein [Bifidobacterium miconisargentati]MBW3090097.1 hypothetical protein [Bifidobacterium miconisargentati]